MKYLSFQLIDPLYTYLARFLSFELTILLLFPHKDLAFFDFFLNGAASGSAADTTRAPPLCDRGSIEPGIPERVCTAHPLRILLRHQLKLQGEHS